VYIGFLTNPILKMRIKNLIRSVLTVPLMLLLLIVTSCQNEVVELADATNEQQLLVANSELVTLLNNFVANNDSSGDSDNDDDDNDNDDNDNDDSNECIRFHYPLMASVYDVDFQVIETITILDTMNLEEFLELLEDSSVIAEFKFPIKLLLEDDSSIEVYNNNELLQALEACD